MSDLVGNPNCWFCHAQALLRYSALNRSATGAAMYGFYLGLLFTGQIFEFAKINCVEIVQFDILYIIFAWTSSTIL